MQLPSIEPERERRPGRVALIASATVLVVAAVVIGVVVGTNGGSPRHRVRSSVHIVHLAAPGRLVVLTATGSLASERPDGAGSTAQGGPPVSGAVAAPDGRFVLDASGSYLWGVLASGLTQEAINLPGAASSSQLPDEPFADRDRLVLAPAGFSGSFAVVLAPRVGRAAPIRLGQADTAAGDPERAAAYVVVSTGRSVPDPRDPQITITPDSSVQWRTARRHAALVITASRAVHLLGLAHPAPLTMNVSPAPAGGLVLVTAQAVTRARPSVFAVLTRQGRLVATFPSGDADDAAWSPDGTTVAIPEGARTRLVLWRPQNGSISTIGLPPLRGAWAHCVWSPTATWLACAGLSGPHFDPTYRLLVDIAGRRTGLTRSGSAPVLWLSTAA